MITSLIECTSFLFICWMAAGILGYARRLTLALEKLADIQPTPEKKGPNYGGIQR